MGSGGADAEAREDVRLLTLMLENLLDDAWKFTSRCPGARIGFSTKNRGRRTRYAVRETWVGFDMAYADQLFSPCLAGTAFRSTPAGSAP